MMGDQKMQRSQKRRSSNPNPNEKLSAKPLSRRAQREQRESEGTPKRTFWVQIRILPIWLRLILIALLLSVVAVIGLRIGYSYIGDGNPEDVLKKETWTHILDIIKGKE